jgi:hypothetical protein
VCPAAPNGFKSSTWTPQCREFNSPPVHHFFPPPAKRRNPALGLAFRHVESNEPRGMPCDPLGPFLIADWVPVWVPFFGAIRLGETLDEVTANLRDAVALHLEGENLAALGFTAEPTILVTLELAPTHAYLRTVR